MAGQSALWEKTKGVRPLVPGEEKTQGETDHGIPVLKVWLQKNQNFLQTDDGKYYLLGNNNNKKVCIYSQV